jgi:hypothetical protein
MTMRVRWVGVAATAIVLGAILVPNSNSAALDRFGPGRNLSLSLEREGGSASVGGSSGGVWAVPAPDANAFRTAAGTGPVSRQGSPDGLQFLAVTVKIGARRGRPMFTNAATVGELLIAMNVKVHRLDVVRPARDSLLFGLARVRLVRIRQAVVTLIEVVPFKTVIQYSSDLAADEVRVLTAGVAGSARRAYRVTYRNGKEIARQLLTDVVLSSPVDRVEEHSTLDAAHGSQTGQASWYDCPDEGDYAAHLTLPKGTSVTVTDLDNGNTVTVVINDRGPYGVPGRIIDLCSTAFATLAPLSQGVADVTITW